MDNFEDLPKVRQKEILEWRKHNQLPKQSFVKKLNNKWTKISLSTFCTVGALGTTTGIVTNQISINNTNVETKKAALEAKNAALINEVYANETALLSSRTPKQLLITMMNYKIK